MFKPIPKKLLQLTQSHSALSRSNDEKRSSTTLLQDFLWRLLRGLIFQTCLKSLCGYLSSSIQASLYHHFNLALSLRPCKDSNPMSPLTASLQVLDEQPRIRLAPPNTTYSNAPACTLFASQTSLPYSRVGFQSLSTIDYESMFRIDFQ